MAYYMTKEQASKIGKLGGRPRGVLSPKTIAKIKTQQAMVEIIQKKAGIILENLFIGSKLLDTSASKELLERGFGKVPQALNVQTVQFSLKELAEYRERVRKGLSLPEEEKKTT